MDSKKILKLVDKEARKLLELLGVTEGVEVELGDGDEGVVVVNVTVEGDELGYMIGNRGRHMQAMQYILSNIVRKQVKEEDQETRVAVVLDVSGYRQQRNEKIEKMALQKADDARILGEAVELHPMSPGDRRIVHTTLSKFDDITTESEGEGRDRYVKIIPKSESDLGITSETEDNAGEGEEEQ